MFYLVYIKGEVVLFIIMLDDNCIYLTQSIIVRDLSKKQFNVLVDVSLKLIDNDILPTYQPKQKKIKYEFKGQRIKRGLYKTKNGTLINADVNAACNIIRKSKQKFNNERLYK